MTIVSVYAIFASPEEAARIGRQTIDERLAACMNIFGPCQSIYRWQGAVESAAEVPAVFKTTSEKAEALIVRIAALHSYEVPCVVQWPVDNLLPSYAEWVEESVA